MTDSGSTLGLTGGGLPPEEPALREGTVLAGRYTIVRFIGRGGMGEVYEADDALLRRRVALKVLLQASMRESSVERFRREVQLALEVTHPNVCRVYDMGCHRLSGDDRAREVYFLTMELLEGETLMERIRREGPFAPDAALPIIRQIAGGLAAAHAQGILHRDLKSSNVILVGDRAAVTDFGLAKLLDNRLQSSSSGGAIAGTLEYMSPEQLTGAELTPASDIYSLGVVMYEMVTGSVPFSGTSPIATAIRSVVEQPPSPRLIAPDLSVEWEEAILRCLRQDPGARYRSPLDLVADLSSGESPESAPVFAGIEPSTRRRRGFLALILVALGAAGAFLIRDCAERRDAGGAGQPEPAGNRAGRPIVALLGFKNLAESADTAWISTALSEMLTAELASSSQARCLPGESVSRLKTDLRLPAADSFSAETLSRVRDACGAQHVVIGSYFASGESFRMDLCLQDTAKGETTRVITRTGNMSQLLSLVASAGTDLRDALGIASLSPEGSKALSSTRPGSIDTVRTYAEGLDQLRGFDALAARNTLQKAVDAEPAYPLTHLALSDTWLALGYAGHAADEAKKAYDFSGPLPPELRLSIEGRYRERARDWTKAIEAYGTLWREFPDSLEDGLRLAIAQIRGAHELDALKTIADLRLLPRPLRDDPRIAMTESSAAAALGDTQRQHSAATRAVEAASAAGAGGSLAEALMLQGDALSNLNRPTEAIVCFEHARKICAEVGNRPGEVSALIAIAAARQEAGGFAEAERLYAEARQAFRKLGDRRGEAWALSRKAIALRLQDDLGGSEESFEEALLIAQEAGNDEAAAAILNNLAVVAWLRGDRDGSKQRTEEAATVCRKMKDKRGESRTLGNYAFMLMQDGEIATACRICDEASRAARDRDDDGVLAETLLRQGECDRLRGEVGSARTSVEKALEIARARGNRPITAAALYELGMVLRELGEPVPARGCGEEAIAILKAIGDERGAVMPRLSLGELDLDQGDAAAAEATARKALSFAPGWRPDNPGAAAADLLARSLLARGDMPGAEAAAQRTVAYLSRGASLELRIAAAITMARVRASAGNPGQARSILAQAQADAARAGLSIREIEVRLAEAEVEEDDGRAEKVAVILKDVAERADALGLSRLARQARRPPGKEIASK
ncbi:MAG: tetratricopeptide repeat protein [Acidobacteria bacterium]|nr:tetratricopeptide repeat protein [Acidobacteriota bacterium]